MTPKRDIARLFMTHYSDRAWDDPAAERDRVLRDVVSLGVGGYCVFGGEVERTREFTRDMEAAAGRPLLVASDLEQGLGQQLEGGTVFPCQMAVGATRSTEIAERVGRAVAMEARSVGINIVFAPVADVATEPANPIIGVRSYGSDPAACSALAGAYVSGCQSEGVAATAKHFPGHGDTLVDSHIDLPVVTVDRRTLDARELVPFRGAIAAGVRAVMAGHIAFPALAGDDVPASLAPEVGESLLRDELGFDGVVVTDALLMGAIAGRHGPGEASVLALLAGADVLLMPSDIEAAIDGVVRAVESDRIGEERISRSLERISRLQKWLRATGGSEGGARPPEGERREIAAGHEALAREVAKHAVTLVSGDGALPAAVFRDEGERPLFGVIVDSERPPDLDHLRSLLRGVAPAADVRVLDTNAESGDYRGLESDAAGAAAFVLLVFDRPAAWRGRTGPPDALIAAADRALL